MNKTIFLLPVIALLFAGCTGEITDSCATEQETFKGTFSEVQAKVFTPYCISCHGKTVQNGNLAY